MNAAPRDRVRRKRTALGALHTLTSALVSRARPRRPRSAAASAERRRDARVGLGSLDPGCRAAIDACTSWLCLAQDQSASADGGVARHFSLVTGWATSYPETTGYIIPTIIDVARRRSDDSLHDRARRMLDWCVAIQWPEGGFQGGMIDSLPRRPVTFNTGQVLLGLAAGAAEYRHPQYRDAMQKAATWLRDSLDPDGCWRRFPTPFAAPGEKTYETHAAWGLFEAERLAPGHQFGAAGLRQVDWALTKQHANGWFASNCLSDPDAPLTHTIGYALRGVIEGHRLSGRADLLAAAGRTADSLTRRIGDDGYLAGRLDHRFTPAVTWVCLTGTAQIAVCLLLLHQLTGDAGYLAAGRRANRYVRRTIRMDAPIGQRGGVKGAFPVDGAYGRWEYLSWAAKFCVDANLLEADIEGQPSA